MTLPFRAIIFDFDGVIADTEPFHFKAFRKVLAEEGMTLTEKEYYRKYLGVDDLGCFKSVLASHGRRPGTEKIASLMARKSCIYTDNIMKKLSFIPGVIAFVKRAAKRYPLAIASCALRQEILMILRKAGIDKAFQVIVSAEDISRGKPDPEGFLKALKNLNRTGNIRRSGKPIKPHECLVIEDSPFGIEGAGRAGMPCLAIATSYTAKDLTEARAVRRNFLGLTPSSLEKLFQSCKAP